MAKAWRNNSSRRRCRVAPGCRCETPFVEPNFTCFGVHTEAKQSWPSCVAVVNQTGRPAHRGGPASSGISVFHLTCSSSLQCRGRPLSWVSLGGETWPSPRGRGTPASPLVRQAGQRPSEPKRKSGRGDCCNWTHCHKRSRNHSVGVHGGSALRSLRGKAVINEFTTCDGSRSRARSIIRSDRGVPGKIFACSAEQERAFLMPHIEASGARLYVERRGRISDRVRS